MKKPAILVVLVIALVISAACAGGAPASLSTSNAAATAAPAVAMTPQPGGQITVVYKDDLATLDPAVGYDWTNWPAIKLVFDGLLDYDETTNLMPRLAEAMPEVSDDATVYTFKLRQGVKFQNGRELTADDVVY